MFNRVNGSVTKEGKWTQSKSPLLGTNICSLSQQGWWSGVLARRKENKEIIQDSLLRSPDLPSPTDNWRSKHSTHTLGFWHPQESLSLNALNTDLLVIGLHHSPLLHLFLLQRVFLGICLSVFNTVSGCDLYDSSFSFVVLTWKLSKLKSLPGTVVTVSSLTAQGHMSVRWSTCKIVWHTDKQNFTILKISTEKPQYFSQKLASCIILTILKTWIL